jgi:hypothetical protein
MNSRILRFGRSTCLLLLGAISVIAASPEPAQIAVWRTPEGGIQPQAVADSAGVVHLVYYKGDPRAGDLFYSRLKDGMTSTATQVNAQKGSAIAIGTIRGAQIALGKAGRVHVVWNGSDSAKASGHAGSPLLYTRLNDSGTAFEPERDMITYAAGLDGGSSVAADGEGNVYVTWHARQPGDQEGEAGRAVFIARSSDEGRTFQRERPALKESTGVCACCGMRAFADARGGLYLLYRGASAVTNRDELLLVSQDRGAHFKVAKSDRWISATCPMSSATLTPGIDGPVGAWETAGQVFYATVDAKTARASKAVAPAGAEPRKHPVAVQNQKGEVLLVWTEGTGWDKGGSVAWQMFNAAGQPLTDKAHVDGVPVWSLATAVAMPDNGFVVIY